MSDKRPAPWRGRKRVADPKDHFIGVRCGEAERAALKAKADLSGLSIGAFVRAVALGSPGPRAVRRISVDREQLARLLGAVGSIGSNINQIARHSNQQRVLPDASTLALMQQDIAVMRSALMQALGRGD